MTVFSRYFAIVMAFIVAIAGAVGVFVGLSLLPEINHAQGTQAEAFTAFGVVIVAVLLGIMALAMSALIGLQLTKTKAVV